MGYRFNKSFRTDFTISRRWDFELGEADAAGTFFEADIKSTAYMFNGYYDLPVKLARFRPFVGVGVGIAHNDLDDIDWIFPPFSGEIPGGRETDFAWQVMAGTTFKVNDRFALDLGYRYYDAGDIVKDAGLDDTGLWLTGPAEGDMQSHEIFAEFNIKLGRK
ncbi:opacity protein and related surface antigen [Candidatus Scalindua japonica]|uniref:Opacity protein and related surface antigen n=1 Tax=Candidatus Scalindua japonica TaxID=1284222 RepID=A0A286U3N8_9BACT|nr:opacity protein and related surface antigen [Candidatus Scalindua japonica]